MKKKIVSIVLAGALMIVLAACSGNSQGSKSGEVVNSSSAATGSSSVTTGSTDSSTATTGSSSDTAKEDVINYTGEWHAVSFTINGEEMSDLFGLGFYISLNMDGMKGDMEFSGEEPDVLELKEDGTGLIAGEDCTWEGTKDMIKFMYTSGDGDIEIAFERGAPTNIDESSGSGESSGTYTINLTSKHTDTVYYGYFEEVGSDSWEHEYMTEAISEDTPIDIEIPDFGNYNIRFETFYHYFDFENVKIDNGDKVEFVWNDGEDPTIIVNSTDKYYGVASEA